MTPQHFEKINVVRRHYNLTPAMAMRLVFFWSLPEETFGIRDLYQHGFITRKYTCVEEALGILLGKKLIVQDGWYPPTIKTRPLERKRYRLSPTVRTQLNTLFHG